MAKIYERSDDIPEHTGPLPPGKPPVHKPPFRDPVDDPEDVDRFLEFLRELNGLDRSDVDSSR